MKSPISLQKRLGLGLTLGMTLLWLGATVGAWLVVQHELNEAFASVVMYLMKKLGVPHDKMNVNGGAIAMGHPLGATGAMIFGTVLDELERRDLNTALVNLCIGGGMGTATIIERV